MKIATVLLLACLPAFADESNLGHAWNLKDGSVVRGDYVSCGTTTLVIKNNGTNCFIPLSKLSDADKKIAGNEYRFHSEFNITYDKFRDAFQYESAKSLKGGQFLAFSLFSISSNTNARPQSVTIEIEGHFPIWTLIPKAQVIVLYDGKRKDMGEVSVDGNFLGKTDRMDDDHMEQLSVTFPFDDFKEIANAKQTEMQIGIIKDVDFEYPSRVSWRVFADHFDFTQ
jgi:hypothetical protein